jgi:Protein of unknown function (DUF2934)
VKFAIPESKKTMATKRVSEKKVVISSSAAAAPARRPKRATRSSVESSTIEVSTPEFSTPEVVSVESVIEISNEAVAQLAYSYWVARGYQGGSPEEDWLRAEQELRAATASN